MYQLAQINIAQMKGKDYTDPIMKDFVDNLDRINLLAENSPGYVWRLKDEQNNALDFRPFPEASLLINVSVWKDIESLKRYVLTAQGNHETQTGGFITLKGFTMRCD